MEYINYIKAKAHLATATKSEEPVLSDEDEKFLNRITSEADDENPPPLPKRPGVLDLPVAGETQIKDAQIALLDGAQNIALPHTPSEEDRQKELEIEATAQQAEKQTPGVGAESENKSPSKRKRPYWSWLRRDSRGAKEKVCYKSECGS